MNITLFFGYGIKNAGDMAITLGSLELISSINNVSNINIVSLFTKDNIEFQKSKSFFQKYHSNIIFHEAPYSINRNGSIINQLISYSKAFKTLVFGNVKLNNIIRKSDIVIFNGGNLLRGTTLTDYLRLVGVFYPLKLALKYGVKYYIFPQSVAKTSVYAQKIISPVLKGARHVFARETISFNVIKERYFIESISDTVDAAFFITRKNFVEPKSNDVINIAITLRNQTIGDIKALSEENTNVILTTYKKSITSLIENGNGNYSFDIIVQTKKDLDISEKLKTSLNLNVNIIEEYDVYNLRGVYERYNLLIGMRLHSLILALSVGTPVIGYFDKQWGYKNPGTLNKFNQCYSYIDENNDFSDEIISILNIKNSKEKILKIIEKERSLIEGYFKKVL